MSNILIIGVGQIGFRYLEGLSKAKLDLDITVVDSSELSLRSVKEHWLQVGAIRPHQKIRWCQTLPKELDNVDLAIIATCSKGRATLINEIAQVVSVRYWILEKVLAQSKQELDLIENATTNAKGIWVNTPRRLMAWHQQLKFKFCNQGSLKVKKIGGLWGLACNSIHFIDLISWWTGESLLSIDTSKLDKIWLESKRRGYFEVAGEIFAKFSGGTELLLKSNPNLVEDTIHIELQNKNIWVIDEGKGIAFESKEDILNGRLELQSDMTGPMVTKILTKGTCELPTLKKSLDQHTIFLDAMLQHWNHSNKCNDKAVPIT